MSRLIFIALSVAITMPGAWANPVRTEKTEAQLVSSVASIAPGQSFDLALRLRPDAGWHTYWKNPGDSGAATKIRWKLPEGFTTTDIQWPPPMRIKIEPLMDFGYEGDAFLVTHLKAPANLKLGTDVTLAASARWLICSNVCIPGRAELSVTLPVSLKPIATRVEPRTLRQFEQARMEAPIPLEGWRARTEVKADEQGSSVILRLEPPAGESLALYREVDFFPDQLEVFDHAKQPPVELKGGALVFRLPRARASDVILKELTGVMVVRRGTGAQIETRSFSVSAPIRQAPNAGDRGWLHLLLFAALGGLLLNLMPCVFPVISMKILSFVSKAGHEPKKVRTHALAFSFGVLTSFWGLAAILLAARAAGQGLGWGFQLQSPVFITALALLFFMLGLNLLGVFEIGGRWMGMGSALTSSAGYTGSFFSGVLATVVATPCTAPFMGAALGFALSQPAPVAFLVFTALGVGMLLPYLLLAFSPHLLGRLPKPGRWMESLKQFLSFPLFATSVWLLWTLALQTHVDIVARALGAMVLVAMGLWITQRWAARRLFQVWGSLLVAAGVIFALMSAHRGRAAGESIAWEPWSEERVAALVADHRPVFVDFTAAWCITCQVNKRVAFNQPEVLKRFEELNLVMLRADWTSYDPAITRALASMGRSGVPVYAVYSGHPGEEPTLLPEVLTAGTVLSELDRVFANPANLGEVAR